jgi:FeS assembly protein IscX
MAYGLQQKQDPSRCIPPNAICYQLWRLRMVLKWQDTEDIAIRLVEEHPESDPLTVRFTDMHAWIVALPDFNDDPKKSNETILEAIQMAWYEEYRDSKS